MLGGVCGGLGYLPAGLVEFVVGVVTGQKGEAREVTRKLVTDGAAIRQTIRMAGEEMGVIAEDTWDDEVWHGVGRKMVFVFAKKDQWVGEHTMRKIKESRGGDGEGKVKCVVDETGLVHGFCTTIEHSEQTAKITGDAVVDMLKTPVK